MTTPIIDFIKDYQEKNPLRLHVPGHKGKGFLGVESWDITEINGADSLYFANGIIKESENNASAIFESQATFYSCEGSSLCIRAMLYMAMKCKKESQGNYVFATRNAHSSFITSASLLGFDVRWLFGRDSYLSVDLSDESLEKALAEHNNKAFRVISNGITIIEAIYYGNVTPSDKQIEIIYNAHSALEKELKDKNNVFAYILKRRLLLPVFDFSKKFKGKK